MKKLFIAAMLTAAAISAVHAEQLTLTETFDPAEMDDPKNVVASIMRETWADDIKQAEGRAFGFVYSLFKVDGTEYLVSMLDSPLCSRDNCMWRVQRLTASYEVVATGKPVHACAERNKVDLTGEHLTICGKEAALP